MTSSTAVPPRRSFFRTVAPFLIIGLAAAVIIGAWALPLENVDRLQRVLTTNLTILVGVLLLAAWLIFLSGWRLWQRMGVLVCAACVIMGAVKKVSFTGDMAPIFHYRWENPMALLEEQRASQKHVEVTAEEIAPKSGDYAEYRGVKRDGVVAGPALAREWKTQPPRELWRQPVGGGYAGFVVQGGVAVTIEQRRDQEAITCYDAATGAEIWTFFYPADFEETMGGPGPRATPTIAGDEVFSLGAVGDLVCLDLRTGKKKWNVKALAGNLNIMWAMSGSPLIYENMVIVNPGAQTPAAKALQAYDRSNGKLIWSSGDTKAGYSSPMVATLAGKPQILLFDADCIAGYDPKDGTRLWKKDWPGFNGINVAQPLALGEDKIYVSRSYDVGAGAVLKISVKDGKWQVSDPPFWENKYLRCKFTSPVLYQEHIYGLDEGIMVCLDAKNGKRLWRGGRYGHGQILLTRDLILVLAEDGKLVLVQATPEEHRELGSIRALPGNKTWNHLALARGIAYLRNHEEMVAYELPLAEKK